ncbi:hypothetical protein BpHYR1_010635 [Brachionus plicatilis]|uniref:Uncharacterized protein n=1 Tax=Brachionus plicatilis TaxID=10195 RepID=A0A3M7S6P6_BRAPC|nr:hypothetical protein BpHYR1_010635 [Brachionus plicatilis]
MTAGKHFVCLIALFPSSSSIDNYLFDEDSNRISKYLFKLLTASIPVVFCKPFFPIQARKGSGFRLDKIKI